VSWQAKSYQMRQREREMETSVRRERLVAVDGRGLLVGLGGDLGLLLGDELLDGGEERGELLLRVLEDVGSLLRDGRVCSAEEGQHETATSRGGGR
jgi:hypothetical protein